MAAGLGYKEFATGDILTAADANGYLASQVVMVFASAAARTSAITSPQEGMISYLKDTNSTEYYSGSAWVAIGGSSSPTFVGCYVYGNTTVSVANATVTTVPFAQEVFDTDGFHSTSTNNSRITVPSGKAGKYIVSGQSYFATNSTGFRQTRITKNGSTYWLAPIPANGTIDAVMNFTFLIDLAVGDYIEMAVYQNSGGNLNLTVDATSNTYMSVSYQGA